MRPGNQPTITGVALCHKEVGDPWFKNKGGVRTSEVLTINAYGIVAGTYQGKSSVGDLRYRCQHSIKTDLRRIGCEAVG